MRRRGLLLALLLLAGLAWAGAAAIRADSSPPGIFVLGIDGVDPVILERMMDEGRMPHFARLAGEGTFQELGTSNPPQSPVAWSNFITGRNPGGHGIFDFLRRTPGTYFPEIALARAEGIMVGPTTGALLHAANIIGASAQGMAVIISPDDATKYISAYAEYL